MQIKRNFINKRLERRATRFSERQSLKDKESPNYHCLATPLETVPNARPKAADHSWRAPG